MFDFSGIFGCTRCFDSSQEEEQNMCANASALELSATYKSNLHRDKRFIEKKKYIRLLTKTCRARL